MREVGPALSVSPCVLPHVACPSSLLLHVCALSYLFARIRFDKCLQYILLVCTANTQTYTLDCNHKPQLSALNVQPVPEMMGTGPEIVIRIQIGILNDHLSYRFKRLMRKETWSLTIHDSVLNSGDPFGFHPTTAHRASRAQGKMVSPAGKLCHSRRLFLHTHAIQLIGGQPSSRWAMFRLNRYDTIWIHPRSSALFLLRSEILAPLPNYCSFSRLIKRLASNASNATPINYVDPSQQVECQFEYSIWYLCLTNSMWVSYGVEHTNNRTLEAYLHQLQEWYQYAQSIKKSERIHVHAHKHWHVYMNVFVQKKGTSAHAHISRCQYMYGCICHIYMYM